MPKSRSENLESDRRLAWQRDMIDALGPDLRQTVCWVWDGTPEALDVLLGIARRFHTPTACVTGIRLYYEHLTRLHARQRGAPLDTLPDTPACPPYVKEEPTS